METLNAADIVLRTHYSLNDEERKGNCCLAVVGDGEFGDWKPNQVFFSQEIPPGSCFWYTLIPKIYSEFKLVLLGFDGETGGHYIRRWEEGNNRTLPVSLPTLPPGSNFHILNASWGISLRAGTRPSIHVEQLLFVKAMNAAEVPEPCTSTIIQQPAPPRNSVAVEKLQMIGKIKENERIQEHMNKRNEPDSPFRGIWLLTNYHLSYRERYSGHVLALELGDAAVTKRGLSNGSPSVPTIRQAGIEYPQGSGCWLFRVIGDVSAFHILVIYRESDDVVVSTAGVPYVSTPVTRGEGLRYHSDVSVPSGMQGPSKSGKLPTHLRSCYSEVFVKMLHDNSFLTLSVLHNHPSIRTRAEAYRLLSDVSTFPTDHTDTVTKGILHTAESLTQCNKHVAFNCQCVEIDSNTETSRPTVDPRFLSPDPADLNESRPTLPDHRPVNEVGATKWSTFYKVLLAIVGVALGGLLALFPMSWSPLDSLQLW